MIYYPLSVLMLAGIREILIISAPQDLPRFQSLFGNGHNIGLSFTYKEQPELKGIAEAFIIGEEFIAGDPVCLILGDNIFNGHSLPEMLKEASVIQPGTVAFGYYVRDPQRYGVVEFDYQQLVLSIQEQPKIPKSNYAVVGLYFYDGQVTEKAKSLNPSWRNEVEITDLNRFYLHEGHLTEKLMGRSCACLETSTHDSLVDATSYVKIIEDQQDQSISCIEEIAYTIGCIDEAGLRDLAKHLEESGYGHSLHHLTSE